LINQLQAQYYNSFTTNVYGRRSFKCYSCTNNFNTPGKYGQATEGCGFGNDFNHADSNVKVVECHTFCQKREIGISGSRVETERSCNPTCQEYNGNTRVNYLIDRVSCCTGNYCNSLPILKSHYLIYLISFIFVKAFLNMNFK